MFEWAADPDRGHLMPAGFRNPFLAHAPDRRSPAGDPLGEPDITMPMATRFLEACDAYQLALFVPLVVFGLRALEPAFLFTEHVEDGWLRVPCLADLRYETKGRRDKRFPLVGCLAELYGARIAAGRRALFHRRAVAEGRERPAPGSEPGPADRRLPSPVCCGRRNRRRPKRTLARRRPPGRGSGPLRPCRGRVRGDCGATRMAGDGDIEGLPPPVRHVHRECGRAGALSPLPDGTRAGAGRHSSYTHLNRLRELFEAALQREWPCLLDVVARRARDLGLLPQVR